MEKIKEFIAYLTGKKLTELEIRTAKKGNKKEIVEILSISDYYLRKAYENNFYIEENKIILEIPSYNLFGDKIFLTKLKKSEYNQNGYLIKKIISERINKMQLDGRIIRKETEYFPNLAWKRKSIQKNF